MYHTALRDEFERYYSTYDACVEPLMEKIRQIAAASPDDSSYLRKTKIIEMFCREAPVHLFENTPLFFEIASGRPRFSWGGLKSPTAMYLNHSTAEHWLKPYADALETDREEGFMHGWDNPVGFDHFCPGYDNLLKLGLRGIIDKAEDALRTCEDP